MEENNKEKKKIDKKIILIAIIVCFTLFLSRYALLGVALLVDIFSYDTSYEVVEDRIEVDKGKLTITDVTGEYDSKRDVYYIIGYVTNNSDKPYGVSLIYKVYDKDNVVIGNVYGDITSLEPGEKGKFKLEYEDIDASEAVDFRIESVNCYKDGF